MTTQEYLNNLITTVPTYILSVEDEKQIKFEGIERFVYKKLSSTRYRASAIPNELELAVKAKIHYCIENRLPIHITVPFGGFKKWQLPSYPDIDWAEVFNIIFLREYLAPIAVAYEYGVLLEYFSDEVFISRMNNYPQADLDKYNNSFRELVQEVRNYLPKNFTMKLSKIRDQISQDEILNRFDKTIADLRIKWQSLPEEEREYRIQKSERNYRSDFENVNEENRIETLIDSTMVHDAFIFGDWDKDIPWAFGKDMIALGFRYTGTWGIHIKSSKTSTAQFWVGIGALKLEGNVYLPTILTYKQLLESKELMIDEVEVFDSKFNNLKSISIVKFK